MDKQQNKNFILAMALSMAVLLGWQYFYAGPKMHEEELRRQKLAQQQGTQQAGGGQTSGGGTTLAPATLLVTRTAALARSPRIVIETPSLSGSIALSGARLDDLTLSRYRVTTDKASANVVLLTPEGAQNAYFAQVGWEGGDGTQIMPADALWKQEGTGKLTPQTPVTLTFDAGGGLLFKRTIKVDGDYMFTLADTVVNGTGRDIGLKPRLEVTRLGDPHTEGQWVIHEGFIGGSAEGGVQEYTYSSIKSSVSHEYQAKGGWLGMTDKYWATTLLPAPGLAYKTRFLYVPEAGPRYIASARADEPLLVAAGKELTFESHLFAGAKEVHKIDGYESALAVPKFSYLIDWGWFFFITKPMFYLIDWLNRLIGNFGLAILTVTLIVKGAFYPIANRAFESMSRMKKLQPEMQKIQERFKDDNLRKQQALMELYKKEKLNPMAGCLPVMLQIPVFFSLYKVLFTTIEMRHAPFVGWIHDLSAPDPTSIFNLFGLIPWTPPHALLIGFWPIVMGITMWMQMKLNPPPPDPVQARMFSYMPLIFTFMLGTMPAGLVIYWAWNNLLTIGQQSLIMHRQGVKVELLDNIRDSFKGLLEGLRKLAGLAGGALQRKPPAGE